MSRDVHVLPINDLSEHDERPDCWCGPTRTYRSDETGVCVLVHHSLDKRELSEPGYDPSIGILKTH